MLEQRLSRRPNFLTFTFEIDSMVREITLQRKKQQLLLYNINITVYIKLKLRKLN